ncbi:MAG: hypothetical protein MHM6MM_007300 [Cercozoa sp. M6MM]
MWPVLLLAIAWSVRARTDVYTHNAAQIVMLESSSLDFEGGEASCDRISFGLSQTPPLQPSLLEQTNSPNRVADGSDLTCNKPDILQSISATAAGRKRLRVHTVLADAPLLQETLKWQQHLSDSYGDYSAATRLVCAERSSSGSRWLRLLPTLRGESISTPCRFAPAFLCASQQETETETETETEAEQEEAQDLRLLLRVEGGKVDPASSRLHVSLHPRGGADSDEDNWLSVATDILDSEEDVESRRVQALLPLAVDTSQTKRLADVALTADQQWHSLSLQALLAEYAGLGTADPGTVDPGTADPGCFDLVARVSFGDGSGAASALTLCLRVPAEHPVVTLVRRVTRGSDLSLWPLLHTASARTVTSLALGVVDLPCEYLRGMVRWLGGGKQGG